MPRTAPEAAQPVKRGEWERLYQEPEMITSSLPANIGSPTLSLLCAAALGALSCAPAALAQEEKTIAIAVKVAGDPWWSRMEEGLKEFDEANPSVRVFMQGVSQSDAALQAQLI